MADSYSIIDGQVVPYSGGRKDTDTTSWRDATELEIEQQEYIARLERENETLKGAIASVLSQQPYMATRVCGVCEELRAALEASTI